MVNRSLNEIANVYVRQNVGCKSVESEQTLAVLDPELPIVNLESQLNMLHQERDSMAPEFTMAHPMVIALNKQIERLTVQLTSLNARARIKNLPNTQQVVLRLYHDVQVHTELYTALLNTAQDPKEVKAGTVGNAKVFDYAVPQYKPVKPDKSRIFLLSLVLGALLGIVTAYVRRSYFFLAATWIPRTAGSKAFSRLGQCSESVFMETAGVTDRGHLTIV